MPGQSEPKRWPRVGVGVLIIRDGKVLIGCRKGSHGAGTYALPGGKLEWEESWADCARREVLEECGIQLGEVTYAHTCEAVIDANNHWITVFMRAEVPSDTLAVNKEPDKCEGWDWYDWKEVPGPRFLPLQKILDDKTYHAVYGEVPPPHLIAGVMMTGGLCVGLCLGIFSTLGISTLLRRR